MFLGLVYGAGQWRVETVEGGRKLILHGNFEQRDQVAMYRSKIWLNGGGFYYYLELYLNHSSNLCRVCHMRSLNVV